MKWFVFSVLIEVAVMLASVAHVGTQPPMFAANDEALPSVPPGFAAVPVRSTMDFSGRVVSGAFHTAPGPRVASATDPVKIKPGNFADFAIPVPKNSSVVWRIYPQPPQRAPDLPPGRVIFNGVPGTTYTATAIIITTDFDAKLQTITDTDYVFQFDGTPPPKPVDPPTPPGPEEQSALTKTFQTAFNSEAPATRAADLVNLRAALTSALDTITDTSYTTRAALVSKINSDTVAKVGKGKLIPLGSAIGDYLDTRLGVSDGTITQDVRGQYLTEYRAVIAALAGVK